MVKGMIKLRVERYHDCPGCGTQLVIDFLGDPAEACACPWCGRADSSGLCASEDELRSYISKAVRDIEQKADSKLTVAR